MCPQCSCYDHVTVCVSHVVPYHTVLQFIESKTNVGHDVTSISLAERTYLHIMLVFRPDTITGEANIHPHYVYVGNHVPTVALNYPACACAARGYVIGRGWCLVSINLHFFLEPIFYLSKYSLSEVYFNTHRLLIEFNGLWYSLAAREVFVAIDSLSIG